jgi:hypothetical protein
MASAKALSPGTSLANKTAQDFLKTKVEAKSMGYSNPKGKNKSLVNKPDTKSGKNQKIFTFGTGDLLSPNSVVHYDKILTSVFKIPTEPDPAPAMVAEPTTDPAEHSNVVEVEGELPPDNFDSYTVVSSRGNRRRMSDTDITPKHNKHKQLKPNGDAGNSGLPVYIRCADPKVNITALNPIAVKKDIVDQFHVPGHMQKAGQSLRVFCSTETQRNRFLLNGISILDHKVVCSLPTGRTESLAKVGMQKPVRRIIGRVSAQVTDEELCTATGAATALRLPARMGQTEDPGTRATQRDTGDMSPVILSYQMGESPPAQVYLGWQTCKLKTYVPEPRRCYNCQGYGHPAKYCKKLPICPVCALGHKYEECPNTGAPKKCANCAGNHSASYKKCPKYVEIKNILKRCAETGESFRDAKKIVVKRGGVDQVSTHPVMQGEPVPATSQTSSAYTYAAAASQKTTTANTARTQAVHNTQADIPLVTPAVNAPVAETAERGTSTSQPRQCNCTAGSVPNIAKFLVLAVQTILLTVQDKELADKLSNSIKKSAAELLGFTGAETLSDISLWVVK